MAETRRKQTIGNSGSGGGDGGEGRKGLNPYAKEFIPAKKPIVQYIREFETRTQMNYNQQNNLQAGNPSRARSYSLGTFDPNTLTRSNRTHVHFDPFRRDSGQPIQKPNEQGLNQDGPLAYQFFLLSKL